MPGYTVKGFSFKMDQEPSLSQSTKEHYEGIGWNAGDALHCRTRAVWDSNMIYMCVDRVPGSMPKKKEYTVKVILKDYSKGSLVPESLKLIYRVTGKPEWKEIRLTPSGLPDQYSASIPGGISGVTVDYYVTAHSNWGTTDTRPRTAPAGWYQFKIE
jgi:hypothetical protein